MSEEIKTVEDILEIIRPGKWDDMTMCMTQYTAVDSQELDKVREYLQSIPKQIIAAKQDAVKRFATRVITKTHENREGMSGIDAAMFILKLLEREAVITETPKTNRDK